MWLHPGSSVGLTGVGVGVTDGDGVSDGFGVSVGFVVASGVSFT